MANQVIIQLLNETAAEEIGGDCIIIVPLADDITMSAKSQYSTLAELVPVIDTIKNKAMAFFGSVSNEVSAGAVELANKFDVPRWQKTDPFRITFKVTLYTKTDAYIDVAVPAKVLQGQSILTKEVKNKKSVYITPGISLQTMKVFGKRSGKGDISSVLKKSKLIALEIPGIIYLPLAMVESAVPTYSKELTESGYPLYASIDLQVISVLPASTEAYDNVLSGSTNTNIGE